jgi:uncharacterized tellurite resistance protein B-like protein
MVVADGKITNEEIEVAEAIGKKLFGDFDPIDFRQICKQSNDSGDVTKIAEVVGEALEEDGKTLLLKYLRAIIDADGDEDASEIQLIVKIADSWGVELPAG